MYQTFLTRKPPDADTRSYFRLKGMVLGCFVRPGMTRPEVLWVIGIRPSG